MKKASNNICFLLIYLLCVLGFVLYGFCEMNSDSEALSELLKKWGFNSIEEVIKSGDLYALFYLSPILRDTLTQQEKDNALLTSAKSGYPYLLDKCKEIGGNIFAVDEVKNNALHLASIANSVYLVEHLITLGLNPNSRNIENYTPLHLCAKSGSPEVARALLFNGADPLISVDEWRNYGPANIAGENKNFEVVRVLKGYDAHYSFETAIYYGDIQMVDEYLKEHPEWLIAPPQRFLPPAVIIAVSANQKDMLLHLLSKGANLDCSTLEGDRPISVAIRDHNMEMIRLLVDLGVNINGIGSARRDVTALEYAIENSDLEIVKLLVDLGADVNLVNVSRESKTPLHFAVEAGKEDILGFLIDKGANINARDVNGMAPLHYAVKKGSIDIVGLLLDKGADIEIVNRNRETPLIFSVAIEKPEVAKYLINRGANLLAKDRNGNSVLHLCAENGFLELIEYIFEKGGGSIDINDTNKKKETPLHMAVRNNRADVVKFLVEKGADIEARDVLGATPLFASLEVDNLDLAKYLVEKGADINVEAFNGKRLVHLAGSSKTVDTIKWLVSLGLDINVRDKEENLPIHYTCMSGELNTLVFLIQKGQPINECNKRGYTPLHIACESGQLIIAKALIDFGADVKLTTPTGRSALHLCAEKGYWGPAQILIIKGVDVNIRDKSGYTPLHLAVMNGEDRFVQLIVARGADICMKNNTGRNAIDLLKESMNWFKLPEGPTYSQVRKYEGFRKTYRLLTALICEDYLVSINSKNVDRTKTLCETYPDFAKIFYLGKAPIHRAVWSHSLDIVRLLISVGVDLNVHEISQEGFTPLHIAVKERQINMVDVLLKNGASKEEKDNKGRTPAELAKELGFEEIYEFLQKN